MGRGQAQIDAESAKTIQEQIHRAFAGAVYPGDDDLRRSNEGDEPYLLEDEFRGETRWQDLDPAFIDQAAGGFASALAFFSDAAFRMMAMVEAGRDQNWPF